MSQTKILISITIVATAIAFGIGYLAKIEVFETATQMQEVQEAK